LKRDGKHHLILYADNVSILDQINMIKEGKEIMEGSNKDVVLEGTLRKRSGLYVYVSSPKCRTES
jgi:hypothetical protein